MLTKIDFEHFNMAIFIFISITFCIDYRKYNYIDIELNYLYRLRTLKNYNIYNNYH